MALRPLPAGRDEASAALEHAHACSLELRRQLSLLAPEEQQAPHIELLLQAVEQSEVIYRITRAELDRTPHTCI